MTLKMSLSIVNRFFKRSRHFFPFSFSPLAVYCIFSFKMSFVYLYRVFCWYSTSYSCPWNCPPLSLYHLSTDTHPVYPWNFPRRKKDNALSGCDTRLMAFWQKLIWSHQSIEALEKDQHGEVIRQKEKCIISD